MDKSAESTDRNIWDTQKESNSTGEAHREVKEKILRTEDALNRRDGVQYEAFTYTVVEEHTFVNRDDAAHFAARRENATVYVKGIGGVKCVAG